MIGRAGYWPDVVRNGTGKAYNRPTWHYELGATHVVGKVSTVPPYPGALPAIATLETQKLYLSQAAALCVAVLKSNKPDSDKMARLVPPIKR